MERTSTPRKRIFKIRYQGSDGEIHLSSSDASPQTSSPAMSSSRNRPRNGRPGGATDVYQELWDECREQLPEISQKANQSTALSKQIIEMNIQLGAKQQNGIPITSPDISTMDNLFRENIKTMETLTPLLNDELLNKLKLIRDHKKQQESEAAKARQETVAAARATTSRSSVVDYDGPSDSPGPSAPEEKPLRSKASGSSRTSSQPPNPPRSSLPPSEPSTSSSRNAATKIQYAVGDAVAFRRKQLNRPDAPADWIQGTVSLVIGEGKSRRYQVRDDEPDPGAPASVRTSASQMVKIPPEGSILADYEPGKTVLALYPDTTTFYRAEVKAMVEGGKMVQLIFEDPENSKPPPVNVARRFVLDHKG